MKTLVCKECGSGCCVCEFEGGSWAAHCMDCDNTIGKRGYYDPCANSEKEAVDMWNALNQDSAQMVYLAAPYSHTDNDVVTHRIAMFAIIDAKLALQGVFTVSPLSKHFSKQFTNVPLTWEFWQHYAKKLMEKCDALYVIMLDGWETSEGVQAEIKLAKKMSLEIKYLDPKDFFIKA